MSLEISPRTPTVTRTIPASLLEAVMRSLVAESHSFYVEPEPDGYWTIYFNQEEASTLDHAVAAARQELEEPEQPWA